MADEPTTRSQAAPLVPSVIDPLTDSRWQELLATGPSDVFHSPQWLRAIGDTYGFQLQALLTMNADSEPVAGIPFCVIDGLPMRRIATPPFSDYCDPIASSVTDWMGLFDALSAAACPITVRCLHNEIPVSAGPMNVASRARWHGLDLKPDIDAIWDGLHPSARRAIRKARKEGVVVRTAQDQGDLRAFFELHLRVRKYKYGLLAQPFEFFRNLWAQFVESGSGALLMAFLDDKMLGGVFLLEWKDTRYYKFNASDPAASWARPNDLITWTAIEEAKERGLTRFDFGLSDWDQDGLVRYKRKYASDEKPIHFLRDEKHEVTSPAATHARKILRELTDLFTDEAVPDELTERAGTLLYPLFA